MKRIFFSVAVNVFFQLESHRQPCCNKCKPTTKERAQINAILLVYFLTTFSHVPDWCKFSDRAVFCHGDGIATA
jgi:hypothetical protein